MYNLKDFINEGREAHGLNKLNESSSVNESELSFKDVKVGDVLYKWSPALKKGGKTRWAKVKILKVISDEKYSERFEVEVLDGDWLGKKGSRVTVWLDKLQKDMSESVSVNEGKEDDISKHTNVRVDAIKEFIKKYDLDINKVHTKVTKGNLEDRLDFMTAVMSAIAPSGKTSGKFAEIYVKELNESDVVNEEAYDWLRDMGLNPRKRYSVREIEREIGRDLDPGEIKWLRSEGVLRESETFNFDLEGSYGLNERELSPLQKEYQEYFKETLGSFDVDSPAKLSAEKKLEFFKKLKAGWQVGKGRK